jgi:inorganic pyrophosphatase
MKTLQIIIETPKFSFIKYKDDGSVDYISPIPCPFNYGSVPNTTSGDGDRLDAIVLGKKLKGGSRAEVPVIGRVVFWDKGEEDPKYICSDKPITNLQKLTLISFFLFFSVAKKVLNKIRRKGGLTQFTGIIYNEDLCYICGKKRPRKDGKDCCYMEQNEI